MKALLAIVFSTLIISTATAGNIKDLKIGFSNPTSILVQLNTSSSTQATITITDQTGKIIKTIQAILSIGNNKVDLLDLTTLSFGTYTVSVLANNELTTTSFIHFDMDK